MTDPARPLESLPASLQDIAEIVGFRAALKIVEQWGGIRLWVPDRVTAEHPLARVIGLAAARKLCASWCRSTEIPIPRAARRLIALRNARICADFAAGVSAPRLARREGLTERMVRYIIAAADTGATRQQDLL